MKTIIALLVFVAIGRTTIAQEVNTSTTKGNEGSGKRGYIGFAIGPSFPLGDFKEQSLIVDQTVMGSESTNTGLQLTGINFGYLFSMNVGIAGTLFGTAYSRTSTFRSSLKAWHCVGMAVGPLFSFPISRRMELDFRPMLGYSFCGGQRQGIVGGPMINGTALLLNMGTVLRFHIAKRGSLLFTADYFSTKMKFEDHGSYYPDGASEQNIKAFSLGLGYAFRLR